MSLCPFFSKTEKIGFAILCNSHRRERAVLEYGENFRLKYFNMTLQCASVRRGKRHCREWNENEAVPEWGCSWRVCIRVIKQPQRALTDHVEQKRKRETKRRRRRSMGQRETVRDKRTEGTLMILLGLKVLWVQSSFWRCQDLTLSSLHTLVVNLEGQNRQRRNVNAFFEGFVPQFYFFTNSSIVMHPLQLHFHTHLFPWSICISSTTSCISLVHLIHEPNGQIRKRKEERNNGAAAAGWTGGWKTVSFVWITPGILHSAVSTCLQKLSRIVADQLRDLLMLMIQFDRFHINSPVGGGMQTIHQLLSHFPNNDLSQHVSAWA